MGFGFLAGPTTAASPDSRVRCSGEPLAMTENEQHEIEVLEERVRDLERQLAQEQAAHLNEKEIWKHELMRAKLNARLQLQDEIASRRAAQFAD